MHRCIAQPVQEAFLCPGIWKRRDHCLLLFSRFRDWALPVWRHFPELKPWPLTCSCAVAASIFCRVCSTVDEDIEMGTLCLSHLMSSHIQDSCKRSHEVRSSSQPESDLGCGIKAKRVGGVEEETWPPLIFVLLSIFRCSRNNFLISVQLEKDLNANETVRSTF